MYRYKRVCEELVKLGAVVCAYDIALYLWFEKNDNGKLIGMLVMMMTFPCVKIKCFITML